MTFGAYSQTSVFIDVYCLVLHYLRTVSAYIVHVLSGLVGPLFITFYLECCYYAAIMLYMVESALGSGTFGNIDWRLWTYFISISRTGICAAIVMSQKIHTEASFSILRFIQNSKQTSGCRCSQTYRSSTSRWPHPRLCVDSWITHDYSTMLKCILNCFALFIAALWISKRRDLMGYVISRNTMRCRYYEM